MKLLVSGGAGFIGSAFVRKIFSNDAISDQIEKVTVIDSLTYAGSIQNLSEIQNEFGFEFVHGDIRDEVLIDRLCKTHTHVVNFAAESHVDRSIRSASEFVSTNVEGLRNILDSIKNRVDHIKFLQVSTDEVYGSISSGNWDEGEPLLPNSPYAATKAAGDLLVRSYFKTYGLNAVVTRSSNNFGPFQNREKLIPTLITNLINGKPLPIYGDGSNVRDWIHVEDNVQGIWLALTKENNSGEIYNLGGGNEISNIDLARKICEFMNISKNVIEYVDDRMGHDFRYSVNCMKAEKDLSFAPGRNFNDSLKSTIAWYQNNQRWWENSYTND